MGITQQGIDNEGAFDRLVVKHQAQVQRFAVRMLGGDADSAEDVSVAVFVKLWQHWDRLETESDARGWLLRCTYRLAVDHLRRRRDLPLCESLPAPTASEATETADAVRRAIEQLSEKNRAVLILTVYEELSYQEAAEALDIPIGTVASRRNEAIRQLKTQLGSWNEQ